MSYPFVSERLANVRQDAQLLVDAGDQERRLEAFVVAGESDVGQAEAAVSQAEDRLSVDEVRRCSRHNSREPWQAPQVPASSSVHTISMRQRVDYCSSCTARTSTWVRCPMRCSWSTTTATSVKYWRTCSRMPGSWSERPRTAWRPCWPPTRCASASSSWTSPCQCGIEATRLIKAVDVTREARVIAYTGSPSFDADPARTMFAAVLQKPATPGVVLAAVQQVAAL